MSKRVSDSDQVNHSIILMQHPRITHTHTGTYSCVKKSAGRAKVPVVGARQSGISRPAVVCAIAHEEKNESQKGHKL